MHSGDLNNDRKLDVVETRWDEIFVLENAPGLCTVPDVTTRKLADAKRVLAARHCRVGTIRWRKAASPAWSGRSGPDPGAVLPKPGQVNLVLSRGPRWAQRSPSSLRPWNRRLPVSRLAAMKRLLLLSTVVVLTGAAPAVGVRASATTIERAASQTDGVVVFASTRDGDSDIYAVNPDEERAHAARERAGRGLRAASVARRPAHPVPGRGRRHGHGGRRKRPSVARGCSFTPEAWSPDSRHVVCSDYEQGLVVLDTVDGTSTQIAESGEMSSWSPDGTTIVFIDENKLFAIPAAGGTRRRLGIHKAEEFAAPTWSPDSRQVGVRLSRH